MTSIETARRAILTDDPDNIECDSILQYLDMGFYIPNDSPFGYYYSIYLNAVPGVPWKRDDTITWQDNGDQSGIVVSVSSDGRYVNLRNCTKLPADSILVSNQAGVEYTTDATYGGGTSLVARGENLILPGTFTGDYDATYMTNHSDQYGVEVQTHYPYPVIASRSILLFTHTMISGAHTSGRVLIGHPPSDTFQKSHLKCSIFGGEIYNTGQGPVGSVTVSDKTIFDPDPDSGSPVNPAEVVLAATYVNFNDPAGGTYGTLNHFMKLRDAAMMKSSADNNLVSAIDNVNVEPNTFSANVDTMSMGVMFFEAGLEPTITEVEQALTEYHEYNKGMQYRNQGYEWKRRMFIGRQGFSRLLPKRFFS